MENENNEDLQEEDLHDFFYNYKEDPYEGLTIKQLWEESEGTSVWIE